MALNASQLSDALQAIMSGPDFPRTGVEAGQRWAHAYAGYAAGAQSLSGDVPPALAANEAALAGILGGVFSNPNGDPGTTASAIASGMTAFWLAPPVVFVGAPISAIVTAVAGTGILQAGLLSVWASLLAGRADAATAAAQHASLFDAFSRTVIVTHIFPPTAPPVVGPIA